MSGRDLRDKFPRKTRIDELGNVVYDYGTESFGAIGAEHHRIHDGKHWEYIQYSADIDTSKGCRIAFFVTGTAAPQHVLMQGNWSAGSRMEVWEYAKLTSTGLKPIIYNSNRRSSNTSDLVVFSGITFSGAATIGGSGYKIKTRYDGAAGNPFSSAPGDIRAGEFIPKANKYYVLWLKPDANDVKGSIGFRWYAEET